MARGWRKHAKDLVEPILEPTPLDWAAIEAWHAKARYLRDTTDMTIRQIAAEVGSTFGPVQRFLNPESKRKGKIRQAEREREKRHTDPEHAEKTRTYVRRFMHHRARKARSECNCGSVADPDRTP
jgi:predicted transcriptional regulator